MCLGEDCEADEARDWDWEAPQEDSAEVAAARARGTCPQVQQEFGPELWRGDAALCKQIQACSMVVGMHPDQATEAIVDCARELGKRWRQPFAVVPCCVFPRLFPLRRVAASFRTQLDASSPPSLQPQPRPPSPPPPPPPPPSENESVPVVTYAQLVHYLEAKSEGVVTFLPFEGSNQVVHSISARVAAESSDGTIK
ncbi:hypothetical protein CYMTET_39925 [Cymbomonas tetramitiformis]|uniref:Uncharacterized protein n=1 Tax=Cymbomonas tetramitiformis TaxID=36881 RepID=A0AAE0C948_9CHLO|nr:hypothetical protein CYMTET_39925 [Cymbomonas tetramitiformis]